MPGFLSLAAISLVNGFVLLVSYFVNHSFPKPLSEQEERNYIKKMAQGDEMAKQILIERNLRLVAHIIKKFERSGEDFDDLVSIGTVGLIKAINSYNPEKATRLATYASRCIENEILMHFRSRKKMNAECSLHEPLGTDQDGNEITLMDLLGTEESEVMDTVFSRMDQENLKQKLKQLSLQ